MKSRPSSSRPRRKRTEDDKGPKRRSRAILTIDNVLAALPKSAHPGAKKALAEIYNAEDVDHARTAAKVFAAEYGIKWPKAAAKITDDLDMLLAFYDYPAEHVGVVDDAVDHRGSDDLVTEHAAPAAEGQVAGQDQARVFVAAGHELEEQVRGVLFEADAADLVDDDQSVAA